MKAIHRINLFLSPDDEIITLFPKEEQPKTEEEWGRLLEQMIGEDRGRERVATRRALFSWAIAIPAIISIILLDLVLPYQAWTPTIIRVLALVMYVAGTSGTAFGGYALCSWAVRRFGT